MADPVISWPIQCATGVMANSHTAVNQQYEINFQEILSSETERTKSMRAQSEIGARAHGA